MLGRFQLRAAAIVVAFRRHDGDAAHRRRRSAEAEGVPRARSEREEGRQGKVVAIVLACLVAAAGIAAVATYQMELWGGKILPNVVGMTQTDATYVLEARASRCAPCR